MRWPARSSAERPRVVLIGDSIRLGYQRLVEARLGSAAEISGPAQNCKDSDMVLSGLDDWVAPGAILVAFNAGLHDLRRSGPDGRHRVEIGRYETNLSNIVRKLRERRATAVFVTTTPVDDERQAASGKPERLAADVRSYNHAARCVMEELEVPVVDLFPLVGPALIGSDGVHLTPDGYAVAADAVAERIAALL